MYVCICARVLAIKMASVVNTLLNHHSLTITVHVCRFIYYNAVADPGGFRRLKSLPPPPPQADSKFKMVWECSGPTVHFTWSNIYLASPVQNPRSFPDNECEGASLPGYMIIHESPRPVGWLGPWIEGP